MSNQKKKKRPIHQRIVDSQHRNDFLIYLKGFLKNITGNDEIFKLIPKSELEWLYSNRFRPIRAKAGVGQRIPKSVLRYCQDQIRLEFKENAVPINIGILEKITYHDFFSIGYTIFAYQEMLKENDYAGASLVKESLSEFAHKMKMEVNPEASKEFAGLTEMLSIVLSDLNLGLCVIKNVKIEKPKDFGFCLEIFEVPTEKKHIIIDGKKRIAHRLGWMTWQSTLEKPTLKMEYTTITGEKLGLLNSIDFEIYIQNHALIRLNERMDDINQGVLHYNTFQSMKNPKISRNNEGNLLIEFRIFEAKTGYFLAEIVDGILLLKTFLFLTNNGTPEGENLHRNTGLMKEDKKYLNIDTISTFLNSDIASNDKIKQIFINAGCESLFKVDKSIYLGEVEKQKELADLVSQYLNLDSDDVRRRRGF